MMKGEKLFSIESNLVDIRFDNVDNFMLSFSIQLDYQ